MPARSAHSPWIVLASRAAHGLVSTLFLGCIATVYVGASRGTADLPTLAAVAALCAEGLLVLLNRGHCPLGPLFSRLGDESPFFELLLPTRAAKLAVPVLAIVTSVGVLLLAVRTL
jgi:hypothetical protein